MRIAELSTCHESTPPAGYGSINRIVSDLTEGLVARGHDVTLFATGDSTTSAALEFLFDRPSADFYRVDDDWVHVITLLRRCHGFDVVHNHNVYAGVALDFLAGSTAYLTTSHTKPNMNFLRHFPDHPFVALSRAHAAMLDPLRVVATIYPGIDVAGYWYAERKSGYLLHLGQIGPHKGTVEAIEIAARAGRELILAGPVAPWHADYFETRIRPRLTGRVSYVGEVGGDRRLALLRDAYCLLLPANGAETFGLAPAEAMASGTPVVGTPRGAIPEVVAPGTTGFLVEGVDGLAAAVDACADIDPAACRRHVADRFDRTRMITQYERLFEEMLG